MEYKLELKLKEKEFDVRPISIEINPPKILENKEIQIKKN